MAATAGTERPERAFEGEQCLSEPDSAIYVSLTYDELDATKAMARVKSPKAGAVVLFAGTIFSSSSHTTITTRLTADQ